ASHYDIRNSDGKCIFYVSIRLRGIALRLSKESLIIAESSKPFLSRDIGICLEDLEDPKVKRFGEMKREGIIVPNYSWAMIPSGENGGQDLRLRWIRMLPRNYQLLDMRNGDLLATFTSDIGFRTCGILQVNKSYERDFELMVLTTFMTLYELAGRKTHVIWEVDRSTLFNKRLKHAVI
ncbi:hypothetical protein IMZ48_39975, partial [Candidatus Bathyarchaeota archaeon]|nr:hypothetical protein [Candidatus Bathyarchaeota archaeon]